MPGKLLVGEWKVDASRNELARGADSVRLEPKAVEVLAFLAGRPGEVVGREELLSAVWPGVVVGDDALTQAIIKLRKALGDDAQQPRASALEQGLGALEIAEAGGARPGHQDHPVHGPGEQ